VKNKDQMVKPISEISDLVASDKNTQEIIMLVISHIHNQGNSDLILCAVKSYLKDMTITALEENRKAILAFKSSSISRMKFSEPKNK